ncbi:MAG: ABC transporter permease [Bacteroidales bacterium]|nr:ABC transporter permease [Bacteroidales bacterium]MBQ2598880.1 ABC transporter permease [Bacteroidales bacterium]
MSASRFIASKLSDGDGRLSHTSNTIAWISVCLSVAIMIIAIAVVAGFKAEIRGRATGFMGSVMLIQPGQAPLNEQYPFSEKLSYRERLAAEPGVTGVSGVAWRSGLIKTDENIDGLYFKGVDSLYDFSFFDDCLVAGELPDYHGRISNDILLSRTTASKLGFEVGDDVVVYFIGEEVKVRKFRLSGLYDAGLEEIDTRMAVADRRHIQRLNGWAADEVSSIEIRIDPHASVEAMNERVEELIYTSMQESDKALFVTNVKKLYGHLFDWLSLLDLNVLMILLLMVVVAGFNMISAILIILFEKISTIGLLKALGMTSREVTKVFLLRAGRLVGKGMLWGNVLGIGLCLIQYWTHIIRLDPANYFVDAVPIRLSLGSILLLDLVAGLLIMALISLSARFIARVSPDRTMRVE